MSAPLAFSGPARPIESSAIGRAALALMVDEPTVRAVQRVESGPSGFLLDGSGRPAILFEAHLFSRATKGRWNTTHPKLSVPTWDRTLYKGGAAEYERLGKAVTLGRAAAIASTSWGAFQILGQHFERCGYADADAYAAGMAQGETEQLLAFCAFVQGDAMMWAGLRRRDWVAFASRYNGSGYAANAYDKKLAAAYEAAGGLNEGRTVPVLASPSTLWMASRGPQVMELQRALRRAGYVLVADGIFGRATETTLMKFQASRGLQADGVAGPLSFRALGLI